MSKTKGSAARLSCRWCRAAIVDKSAWADRFAHVELCDDCRIEMRGPGPNAVPGRARQPAKGSALAITQSALRKKVDCISSDKRKPCTTAEASMQTVAPAPLAIYTRTEAAKCLGVSASYIDQLLREGRATRSAATAGGRPLFTADDLQALARLIKREDRLPAKAA